MNCTVQTFRDAALMYVKVAQLRSIHIIGAKAGRCFRETA